MAKLTQLYPICAVDHLQNGTVIEHYIAGETVDVGKVVYFDATLGTAKVADASSSGKHTPAGITLQDKKVARQAVKVMKRGLIAGFDLSGLAYGALVYLDTTGDLADAANGTTTVPVARVVPTTRPDSAGAPEKVLEVCFTPIVSY